jgi:hypothetical protein
VLVDSVLVDSVLEGVELVDSVLVGGPSRKRQRNHRLADFQSRSLRWKLIMACCSSTVTVRLLVGWGGSSSTEST